MTRLLHTASFQATNHKYCSTHSDNTKHTTCRDLLLCVSVGDRLMARVVFALHNQSWNLVEGAVKLVHNRKYLEGGREFFLWFFIYVTVNFLTFILCFWDYVGKSSTNVCCQNLRFCMFLLTVIPPLFSYYVWQSNNIHSITYVIMSFPGLNFSQASVSSGLV